MSIELSFDIGVLNPWGGCLGQSPKETKLLTPSLNDYSKLLQPVYDTLKLFNQQGLAFIWDAKHKSTISGDLYEARHI